MKNFIQIGDVLDHVAQANIRSGELVAIGSRVGIAVTNIKKGDTGALRVKGVATVNKAAGANIKQGALLYFDASTATVSGQTSVAEGQTPPPAIGYAAADSDANATTVALHLNA